MNVAAQFILTCAMLLVFVGWLVLLLTIVWPACVANLKDVDPVLTMVAGLGIGGITQFFIGVLTLSWQFWYRKAPPEKKEKT